MATTTRQLCVDVATAIGALTSSGNPLLNRVEVVPVMDVPSLMAQPRFPYAAVWAEATAGMADTIAAFTGILSVSVCASRPRDTTGVALAETLQTIADAVQLALAASREWCVYLNWEAQETMEYPVGMDGSMMLGVVTMQWRFMIAR